MRWRLLTSLFVVTATVVACAQANPTAPFVRHTCTDKYHRTITYYLSASKATGKKPLVLLVLGSGGQSLWTKRGDKVYGGLQNLLFAAAGDKARVLVVEKPGVEFGFMPPRPGTAEGCPKAFLEEHTFERWVEANVAAVRDASKQPGIDGQGVLAMGHSEGGIVVAGVAARWPKVSHAAVLAGGGPTQLFDMMEFFGAEPALKEWAEIQKDPMSADKLAWGHPFRRWSTFLATSPVKELLRSKAKVMAVQGMADKSVSPRSVDVLEAELRSQGREVVVKRIENAGHDFAKPGQPPQDSLRGVFTDVLGWWLGAK
jgi:pimeloyl-ACP methyl ester carboxylesterase